MEELTDLVEEAVLEEFLRINERGGVLGAMETQYQRGKIQEESMLYEHLKHSGELPIVGVNTFIDPKTLDAGYVPPKIELARASYAEKQAQLDRLRVYEQGRSRTGTRESSPLGPLWRERLRGVDVGGPSLFIVPDVSSPLRSRRPVP
jgi:isobutyryl-CoA mutase